MKKDFIKSKEMLMLLIALVTGICIYFSIPKFFKTEKINDLVERMENFEKNS